MRQLPRAAPGGRRDDRRAQAALVHRAHPARERARRRDRARRRRPAGRRERQDLALEPRPAHDLRDRPRPAAQPGVARARRRARAARAHRGRRGALQHGRRSRRPAAPCSPSAVPVTVRERPLAGPRTQAGGSPRATVPTTPNSSGRCASCARRSPTSATSPPTSSSAMRCCGRWRASGRAPPAQLLGISGVGEKKLADFGAAFPRRDRPFGSVSRRALRALQGTGVTMGNRLPARLGRAAETGKSEHGHAKGRGDRRRAPPARAARVGARRGRVRGALGSRRARRDSPSSASGGRMRSSST